MSDNAFWLGVAAWGLLVMVVIIDRHVTTPQQPQQPSVPCTGAGPIRSDGSTKMVLVCRDGQAILVNR